MSITTTSSKSASYFTYDHVHKSIVGSEFNFKMAGNPNKPQYDALMVAMDRHPNYTLAPIASTKKIEKKQTYEGLTMSLMEEYLNIYEGELADFAREKFAEMKQQHKDKKMSYPTIKSWFLDLFPNFNVNQAKLKLKAKKLETTKAPYKVIKVSVAVPQTANN